MLVSNPILFTVTPTAVVHRIHQRAMPDGFLPASGEHVLEILPYEDQSYVRATYPGAQVAESFRIKAADRNQPMHIHGWLRSEASLSVLVGVTLWLGDLSDGHKVHRERSIDVGPDEWTPFDIEMDIFEFTDGMIEFSYNDTPAVA